ncbi:hypothetical protein LJC63_00775 [Ruminococcaceae bacterium OttesenSCG-928-L11]|nr:hypothetical protein [Ruminococcaceae bacterium OttesenSCG-928-L11]
MQNRKYFPFERNSYYMGKLLTAKDFEAEQRYFNDKRRFSNRLLGANGIVSGLGVVFADDTSIALQAGSAFDASGREIVVPTTKVIKLSTIEGHGSLTTTNAYLGISYAETPADEVYAPMRADESNTDKFFNKIREGYKLTLMDESLVAKLSRPVDEYVTSLIIYSDQEVIITQSVPKYLTLGSHIAVEVEIRKTGHGTGEYSFAYELDIPGFTTAEGEKRINVQAGGLRLAHGDTYSLRYVLMPQAHLWGGDATVLTATDVIIQKNDESFVLNEKLESVIKPVDKDIDSLFLSNWYKKSMDTTLENSYDDRLWIASLHLIRQKSSILIDKVLPPPFGQYVYNAQQLMQMKMLEQHYPAAGAPSAQMTTSGDAVPALFRTGGDSDGGRNTASGAFDLGLGLGYNTRDVVFSEEIMHGLGKGPVHVEVGIEFITSGNQDGEKSEVILGEAALFAGDASGHSEERIYHVSHAVKILPERGTFVVAVLPKEISGLISIRIRWFAMRYNEVNKQIRGAHDGEKCILINPDTIIVAPKATAHISPVFINMPSEACNYEVLDPDGGTVDNNGIYTAPARDGVYEVKVSAISNAAIYAHAFVIVTQKKREEKKKES